MRCKEECQRRKWKVKEEELGEETKRGERRQKVEKLKMKSLITTVEEQRRREKRETT